MKPLRCDICGAKSFDQAGHCELCGSPSRAAALGRPSTSARQHAPRSFDHEETHDLGAALAETKRRASRRLQTPTRRHRATPERIFLVSAIFSEPQAILRDTPALIGRGADARVQIPIKLVSRRHAIIEAGPDGFVLRDLGSTNGTTLNNESIQQAKLAHRDVLGIGPFELQVRFSLDEPEQRELSDDLMQSETHMIGVGASSFCGDLSRIKPGEVLQVLELNGVSGRLFFQRSGQDQGLIVLLNGRMIHAEFAGMIPADAVLSLLTATDGSVQFQAAPTEHVADTLGKPNQLLLLEAARRSDEEIHEHSDQVR